MAGYLWLSDGEVEGEGEYAEGSDVVCFFFLFFWGLVLVLGGWGMFYPLTSVRERKLLDRIPSRKIEQQVEFYNTYIYILTFPTPHHL